MKTEQSIKEARLKYSELCNKAKGKLLKSVELDYIDVVYSYYELPISNNAKKKVAISQLICAEN